MLLVQIPKGAKVFILEDQEERITWFRKKLESCGVAVTLSDDVRDAIQKLKADGPFEYFFLDHDLGDLDNLEDKERGDGLEFCQHLAESDFTGENTVIHSVNPTGAAKMLYTIHAAYVIPFGRFEIEVVE